MKKTTISFYSLSLFLIIHIYTIIFMGTTATVFAEAPKIIKFATLAPEGSTWLKVIGDISNDLLDKSKGDLRLKVYAGGISGDEKDVLRKMQIGQLHCAGFTGIGLGEILNEVRIFDLPFFFKNYEEVDIIRNKLKDRFGGAFNDKGYILLGWTEVGFVYFFSNIMIDSMETLRSTKMWIWENDPIAKALFDCINLRPIPLSVTDVMTSLQTGLIDSVYVSPLGAVSLQWFTKVKYMLDMPLANAVGAILMTKKYYDSLSPDLQIVLKDTFRSHMERLTQLTRKDNNESIEVIKESGVKVLSVDNEAIKEFEQANRKACEIAAKNLFPAKLIENITAEIKEYRENNK